MANEGIADVVAKQDWMQPIEEDLQNAVRSAFPESDTGHKIKNFLHGTWIGEPLHIILTDVPIGAWTAATVLDVVDAVDSRKEWQMAADAAIAIGLVGAGAAAVAGITDWQDTDPPARRIGMTHGLLNLAAAGLFTASYIARKRESRAVGRALSALGYAIATVSAHLGGNLVYEQRVGIDHAASEALPEDFVSVLAETELPENQPRRAMFQGSPVLLVRRGGRIFALAETCSHLGGPLSEGEIVDGTIQCPWHGSRFSLADGTVIDGPAVHAQPCLDVRVRDGNIEVRKRKMA